MDTLPRRTMSTTMHARLQRSGFSTRYCLRGTLTKMSPDVVARRHFLRRPTKTPAEEHLEECSVCYIRDACYFRLHYSFGRE